MAVEKSLTNDKLLEKTWNRKHNSKLVASITYTLEKNFFAAATFEGLSVV